MARQDVTRKRAVLLSAAASGGVTGLKATVAVGSTDATKAMHVAKRVIKGFRPAG